MDYKDDRYLKKNQVADNGLLDRRLFLKRGLQFGVITTLTSTASLTSAKENQNTSQNKSSDSTRAHKSEKSFSTYGLPSKFEDNVPDAVVATFTDSLITNPLAMLSTYVLIAF